MNILFIVTELNSANGICTQSVMRELVSRGDCVYCISNDEPHGTLLAGVKYSFVRARLVYRLLSSKRRLVVLIGAILNKIKLLISYPVWPLISPLYCRRIYKAARKICRENKIDMIIPIYTQIDTLIAASMIKKKQPHIKYIPYFLDSLSGGYGPKCFSKEWVIQRGIKWEDRLLPSADKVVMMQSSKKHYTTYAYNKAYYSRIVFLDIPLMTRPQQTISSKSSDGLVHLTFVGSIPVHKRNPEMFLQVFQKLDNPHYRLHIIGTSTCPEMLHQYAAQDPRIILEGQISHAEAMQRIAKADVLVNFGNNNSSMTPSKIFEYMSYGKPIISTLPIPDEPSAQYLVKYPLAFLVNYANIDVDKVAEKMQEWIESVIGCVIPFDEIEKNFTDNTPQSFANQVTM